MEIVDFRGVRIVTQHIFPASELEVGSRWISSSGAVVTLVHVEPHEEFPDVTYVTANGASHTKDSWAFQVRYCLILEKGE